MLKQFAAIAGVLLVSGCAPSLPHFRMEALTRAYAIKAQGGQGYFPSEYASLLAALDAGDRLMQKDGGEEADRYYLLALRKADILARKLAEAKERQEADRREAEERQREADRRKSLEDLRRKLEAERIRNERESRTMAEKSGSAGVKERESRQLPQYHTVKRGETLPQIAAQPEVYNDVTLWPLLYRANRDQIRDPRRIWPGQVLRIPRNVSREDLAEARRHAQERPVP